MNVSGALPQRETHGGLPLGRNGSAAVGCAGLVSLLAALGMTVGLSVAGWLVGLACGAVLVAAVARGLARAGRDSLGPGDRVTLSRGLLACGAAALTVDVVTVDVVTARHVIPALLAVAVPALVLDAVDGLVARRTGTVTAFGGRFDGEVDAFLILVLSVAVGSSIGWWVVAAGLVRYVFAVAGWALPWLRATLEFRYWRKVVTAAVGVVLAVALADVLPRGWTVTAVAGALLLLAESFVRDVWWLWRRRPLPDAGQRGTPTPRGDAAVVGTALAVALVWLALVAPNRPDRLTPAAFLRVPAEVVVVAALGLVLTARSRRAVSLVVGLVLGALTLLKVLDLGAFAVLDRPFNVVTDRGQFGSGLAFVGDSLGVWAATGAVVAAVGIVAALAVGLPWAVGRLTSATARHRQASGRAVGALATVWVVCALSGVQVVAREPLASADATPFVVEKVRAGTAAFRDRAAFDRAVATDRLVEPSSSDLGELRGKDVALVFVESYGRVAVEGPDSEPLRELLDAGTARLGALGYSARSAYLTSPTFGSSSWLAHATLQSGLWVSDQDRYDRLLTTRRTTLTSVFARSGWRTAAVLPATRGRWPEGQAFYDFDQVYDRSSLGYAGPTFGFSTMPDQYALSAFERLELARSPRSPVMAEIELTSSHGPWAPLPTTVAWADLGDGSIFHGIRSRAVTAAELWSDRADVPSAYRTSIEYSLSSLVSFVEHFGDDDLVLVLVGDHQPSTIVSGFGGNRDVPVTIVAHDPAVIERLSDWDWQDGLRPDEHAPVWRMDAFRDRFVAAYSHPTSASLAQGASHEGG